MTSSEMPVIGMETIIEDPPTPPGSCFTSCFTAAAGVLSVGMRIEFVFGSLNVSYPPSVSSLGSLSVACEADEAIEDALLELVVRFRPPPLLDEAAATSDPGPPLLDDGGENREGRPPALPPVCGMLSFGCLTGDVLLSELLSEGGRFLPW